MITCFSPSECGDRRMCNCMRGVWPGMRQTPTAELVRTGLAKPLPLDVASRPAYLVDEELPAFQEVAF